jgi:AraC-like DNA-binding protein
MRFLLNEVMEAYLTAEDSQLEGFDNGGINSILLKNSPTAFRWPIVMAPRLYTAGRYPLDREGFSFTYRGSTHALHLHLYEGAVRIGREQFTLKPGDLTFTLAGTPSSYDLTAPGQHWCIHFWPVKASGKKSDLLRLPLYCPLGPRQGHAIERIAEISRLFARANEDLLASAAASTAFQSLLLWLGMKTREQSTSPLVQRSDTAVERAATLLQSRLAEPLTVPQLAADVGLSQNYLARRFRQRFGMTIPHYLLSHRIEHAKHLLASTDIPIWRIAARVGIPDPQHFNKQFRRLNGVSPSAVRQQNKV